MNSTHIKPILFIIVLVGGALLVFMGDELQLGYRHDEGVLTEGTLVDYRYNVIKRNHQGVAVVDGKLQAVSTWRISYVDENGKFGRCDYVKPRGGESLITNEHVKCYTGEIQFN